LPLDAEEPRSINTSTFAMRLADGTSWFVYSTPLVLGGARLELRDELLQADPAVRTWNQGQNP